MKIDKLNFICFLQGNTGYSVLSRSLIGLMEHLGMDIRVENLYNTPVQRYIHLQNKDPRDRFQLLHQIPTVRPEADGFYTVTEFDQPPYGSISPIRNAKLILTESTFCKKIFEEFTDAEVHVIHYPIDPQFKPSGVKLRFDPMIEKFRFKFLSMFEWIMRKDPYTLIQAFTEEFSPDEDCCLILRCWSKSTYPYKNPRPEIGKLAGDHNVIFMPMNIDNLPALYRACDCFVTSTWGEGFGHPIAEAMACGMKVIAPDSTGIKDYLTKSNGIPVPVKEEPVGKSYNEIPHLIKPWFNCWKPEKEELKKAMRKAFKNEMKFIRQNAPKIRNKFSFDKVTQEIREAFEIAS